MKRWARKNIEVVKTLRDILAAAESGEVTSVAMVVVTDDGAAELVVAGNTESEDLAEWTDEMSAWLRSEQPIG
jgi:hypothetical protein